MYNNDSKIEIFIIFGLYSNFTNTGYFTLFAWIGSRFMMIGICPKMIYYNISLHTDIKQLKYVINKYLVSGAVCMKTSMCY